MDAVFSGHLHRYERRTVAACRRSPWARAARVPARSRTRSRREGADVSLLDIGALTVDVRDDSIGYTYLDKHGAVLDQVVI